MCTFYGIFDISSYIEIISLLHDVKCHYEFSGNTRKAFIPMLFSISRNFCRPVWKILQPSAPFLCISSTRTVPSMLNLSTRTSNLRNLVMVIFNTIQNLCTQHFWLCLWPVSKKNFISLAVTVRYVSALNLKLYINFVCLPCYFTSTNNKVAAYLKMQCPTAFQDYTSSAVIVNSLYTFSLPTWNKWHNSTVQMCKIK